MGRRYFIRFELLVDASGRARKCAIVARKEPAPRIFKAWSSLAASTKNHGLISTFLCTPG